MAIVNIELLTVEDYRALGEGPPHYQLIEGEIFMAPSPNRFHQDVALNVAFLLKRYVEDSSTGIVYIAPFDVYLDDVNVFQPDILFISNERRGILADDGAHGAPDLVVEILSPSTTKLDKRKRSIFAKHGTREFWQIDPNLLQIQRFDFAVDLLKPVQLIDEGETFTSPLFPGLTLATSAIFKR